MAVVAGGAAVNEVIVVGSGATGAIAAQTLVERGFDVLMLDGGQRDDHYRKLIPDLDFVEIRSRVQEQNRFFLGDRFEGLPQDAVSTGAQLTPPRQFITAQVDRFLPVDSQTFSPMESLALGGLGSGWGLGCCVFSDGELAQAGLSPQPMREAYQLIASRIGISGEDDDARPYTSAHIGGVQPPVPMDPTAQVIYRRYLHNRQRLRKNSFAVGRPALALLTEPKDGRGATALHDMDFYSDRERAAWRPWIGVEALRQKSNFEYRDNLLVTSFEENGGFTTVRALDMITLQHRTFTCRKLVLAAGALGSARIVLRSFGERKRLPFLCNAYSYLPCLVPSRIGKQPPRKNSGFAQLALFYDREAQGEGIAMGSLYSYRSLMLYRLLAETPLGYKPARQLMRYLVPALLILGIHHPQSPSPGKSIELIADPHAPTSDRLSIEYALTPQESQRIARCEDQFSRAMLTLGAVPVKRVHPPAGSSIHYAGTLPFGETGERFTLAADGRLNGTQTVFVADGSGFRYLPAKGLTLSLMANAHVVATAIPRDGAGR